MLSLSGHIFFPKNVVYLERKFNFFIISCHNFLMNPKGEDCTESQSFILPRWRRYAYILMLKSLPYNVSPTKINSVEMFRKIMNRNIQQVNLTAHKIVFTRVLVKKQFINLQQNIIISLKEFAISSNIHSYFIIFDWKERSIARLYNFCT